MKRRNFLTAAGLSTLFPFSMYANSNKNKEEDQQYVELIKYHVPLGNKKNVVEDFYRDVAIPALGEMGVGPVGVFKPKYGMNKPSLWVMIQHKDLDSFVNLSDRLMENDTFMNKGSAVLNNELSDPNFIRVEKILYQNFKYLPVIEVPEQKMGNASRIYELRIYESHNMIAAKKKIEMFNEGGEIEIFKKTGLNPVFFGETLAGPLMPNLTYMLVFDDMADRDKNWKVFVDSPEWKTLSADPQYKDTVSNISDIILSPASCSQI
jgi:hypothetical protein